MPKKVYCMIFLALTRPHFVKQEGLRSPSFIKLGKAVKEKLFEDILI